MDCLGQRLAMMEVWHFGEISSCNKHLAVCSWTQLDCSSSCAHPSLALRSHNTGRWAHSRLDSFFNNLRALS